MLLIRKFQVSGLLRKKVHYYCPYVRPKSKVFNCLLKECTDSASLILRGRSFHREGPIFALPGPKILTIVLELGLWRWEGPSSPARVSAHGGRDRRRQNCDPRTWCEFVVQPGEWGRLQSGVCVQVYREQQAHTGTHVGAWHRNVEYEHEKGNTGHSFIWNQEYKTTKITQFWNMGRGKIWIWEHGSNKVISKFELRNLYSQGPFGIPILISYVLTLALSRFWGIVFVTSGCRPFKIQVFTDIDRAILTCHVSVIHWTMAVEGNVLVWESHNAWTSQTDLRKLFNWPSYDCRE